MTDAIDRLRLFSYKQTHDTGFAPNPFYGVCTLATCKPRIREAKRIGDWIAGFTSTRLNGDTIGNERLIFLMRVAEKLPFEVYHTDPRFVAKIPVGGSARTVDTVGDNIYGKRDDGTIFQVPNRSHAAKDTAKDTSGRFVLIGTTFAYFGSAPLFIPDEVRPEIPPGQAGHGVRTKDRVRAQAFVNFVLAYGRGIHAQPTSWRTGDTSWKAQRPCG
jgi:hypothetical protein